MDDTEHVEQAIIDWREDRAYIDGQGNYHVKRDGHHSGPIAPWNKAAKQRFATVTDLHRTAFRKEAKQWQDKDSIRARRSTRGTMPTRTARASWPTRT